MMSFWQNCPRPVKRVFNEQRIKDPLREVKLADGWDDMFGMEHHRPDYAVSSPATLFGGSSITKTLNSQMRVSVLSSDDPIRISAVCNYWPYFGR